MIINKPGEKFEYNGIEYIIGEEIVGTENSEYNGLTGSIYEIRTSDDKQTDNETPDFYCAFEAHITGYDIQELEKTFSELYGEHKKLGEICLDSVILTPDMVQPIAYIEKNTQERDVYVLEEDWAANYDYGHSIDIFSDADSAKREMLKILKKELNDGCIPSFNSNDNYEEESEEYSFRCFIEGDYIDNHYEISVKKKTMKVSYAFLLETLKKYIDR